MTEQSLSSGRTAADRFSGLGVASARTSISPRYAKGIIVGLPGSGKTSFLGSCPEALLLNLDCATIPEQVVAGVWPPVNDHGVPLDDQGRPTPMTWPRLESLITKLRRMSQQDQPRPEMVIIDTITAMLDLAKDEVVRRSNKSNFKELHGEAAWDDAYGIMTSYINELHRLGYGVWTTFHVVLKDVRVSEDQSEQMMVPATPPGLWKRIHWQVDIILAVDQTFEPVEKQVPLRDAQGNVVRHRTETGYTSVLRLLARDKRFTGVVKCKKSFEGMNLPESGAWAEFENTYASS